MSAAFRSMIMYQSCMTRTPRSQLLPGWFHCINRGVNKNSLFLDDRDFAGFSEDLRRLSVKFGLTIGAYCLMTNHWHIVLECQSIESMSSFFKTLLNNHTKRHHTKYETIGLGPIYQGRFRSIPIKSESALAAISEYVLLNPVRAKLVTKVEEWPWTSVWGQSGDSHLTVR